jgi:hypothetical protein
MASYDKVRDNRLRRMADRQGLKLERSRRRDPLATDYGMYRLAGPDTEVVHYFPDMDEVEEYLTRPRQKSPGRTD